MLLFFPDRLAADGRSTKLFREQPAFSSTSVSIWGQAQNHQAWGTLMTQSVKHQTPDLSSGPDLRVREFGSR